MSLDPVQTMVLRVSEAAEVSRRLFWDLWLTSGDQLAQTPIYYGGKLPWEVAMDILYSGLSNLFKMEPSNSYSLVNYLLRSFR